MSKKQRKRTNSELEVVLTPEQRLEGCLGHLVAVHWVDTKSISAWLDPKDAMEFSTSSAISIGVLLSVSEDKIVLASDWLLAAGAATVVGDSYVLESTTPEALSGVTAVPRAWLATFADYGRVFDRSVISKLCEKVSSDDKANSKRYTK